MPVVSFSFAFLGESGVVQTGICLSRIISYPHHALCLGDFVGGARPAYLGRGGLL